MKNNIFIDFHSAADGSKWRKANCTLDGRAIEMFVTLYRPVVPDFQCHSFLVYNRDKIMVHSVCQGSDAPIGYAVKVPKAFMCHAPPHSLIVKEKALKDEPVFSVVLSQGFLRVFRDDKRGVTAFVNTSPMNPADWR